MTKVPTDLSGRDLVRALEKIGFVVKRQTQSTDTKSFVVRHHNTSGGFVPTQNNVAALRANISVEELLKLL